jgi:hypothetical protein
MDRSSIIYSSIILGRLGEKRSPTSFVESPVVSLSLTIECENNKVEHVFNMTRDKSVKTKAYSDADIDKFLRDLIRQPDKPQPRDGD